jgi:hypothetical protein
MMDFLFSIRQNIIKEQTIIAQQLVDLLQQKNAQKFQIVSIDAIKTQEDQITQTMKR